jgi:peptide/nickel transport system substrate-binding protein
MNVTVSQLATPAWLNSNVNGDMSMTPLQYVAADPAALDLWFTPGQYYNWSHYTNPKLTALIKAGEATSVISQREKIYAQAQTLIMQEAVMLPLYENEDLVLTSKKLTGITYAGGGFEYFLGAALSKS